MNELAVRHVQQAQRFRFQLQAGALVEHRLDAGEQLAIQVDGIAVRCQLRRDVGLDLLQRIVGVGPGQVEEDAGGTAQHLAGAFHRHQRVLESRGGRIVRDGGDFRPMAAHAFGQGGREVAVLDAAKIRCLEFQRAGIGERRSRDRRGRARGGIQGRDTDSRQQNGRQQTLDRRHKTLPNAQEPRGRNRAAPLGQMLADYLRAANSLSAKAMKCDQLGVATWPYGCWRKATLPVASVVSIGGRASVPMPFLP